MTTLESAQTTKEKFAQDGYIIVKAAVTPERAAYLRDRQLHWVEKSGEGFDRNKKATWEKEKLPVNFKAGIYAGDCLSHEKFMWEARLEPGVIQPFAELWETESLLVSFDGMNVTVPETNKGAINMIPPWPHTDQHESDRGFVCAQGLLNTGPCGPRDGGLIVFEGSAPLWTEFWESDLGKAKRTKQGSAKRMDLTRFSEAEIGWFEKRGCKEKKLELEAGDLVIWDSRTIHHNCAPKSGLLRTAIYVCYAPAELATNQDLETKIGLFYGHQSSNHWPHVNVRGMRKGSRKIPMEAHEPTEKLLQLAGVKRYTKN